VASAGPNACPDLAQQHVKQSAEHRRVTRARVSNEFSGNMPVSRSDPVEAPESEERKRYTLVRKPSVTTANLRIGRREHVKADRHNSW
jgi:hypothetical protein